MQGVSKLVEHGNDVGEADQGRFAGGRLGQVGDVVHDGEVPRRRDWPTNSDIQAPPFLLSRLK